MSERFSSVSSEHRLMAIVAEHKRLRCMVSKNFPPQKFPSFQWLGSLPGWNAYFSDTPTAAAPPIAKEHLQTRFPEQLLCSRNAAGVAETSSQAFSCRELNSTQFKEDRNKHVNSICGVSSLLTFLETH